LITTAIANFHSSKHLPAATFCFIEGLESTGGRWGSVELKATLAADQVDFSRFL